jgi:hypothetical protein
MQLPTDIVLRLFCAVFAPLLLRDGYAGLRGRGFRVQNKARYWVYVRDGWEARIHGGLLFLMGLGLLIFVFYGFW